MTQALVIIDLQNDYFPGGKMELVGTEAAAEKAGSVLAKFRDSGRPIFHMQHLAAAPELGFFLPETEGAEIHASVKPENGETVIQKYYPSSFRETDLEQRLRDQGIENVVFCGAMSHMCVDTTVRAAADLGFNCTLIDDACATRELDFEGKTVAAGDVQTAYMSALAFAFANVIKANDLQL